eukprot:7530067-Pyramimonas_sp.AAC.1
MPNPRTGFIRFRRRPCRSEGGARSARLPFAPRRLATEPALPRPPPPAQRWPWLLGKGPGTFHQLELQGVFAWARR